MTVAETLRYIVERLSPAVASPGEARVMAGMIMESLKGYSATDLIIKADSPVSDYIMTKVNEAVERLLRHEPIQYITGYTTFYGLKLAVNSSVLIPRQETTELVEMIVGEWRDKTDLRVADLCAGSGCIALTLARNLPFSKVTAVELSDAAIEVARENARSLKCNIRIVKADVLKMPPPFTPQYDIIVSNPPYVLERERSEMEANVLDYEPEMALFVPDDDPLRFYKAINRYAAAALRPGGKIYYELNPLEADKLADLMRNEGWEDVEITLDISRRKRFISARRSADKK